MHTVLTRNGIRQLCSLLPAVMAFLLMPMTINSQQKTVPRKNVDAPRKRKIVRPWFVLAKHVMIHDGKVVTWDGIRTRLKELSRTADVQPAFYFTQSNEYFKSEHWVKLQKKIGFKVYSFGSTQVDELYDSITSQKDLKPDPKRRKSGRIFLPNGKPAAGAEVLCRSPSRPGTRHMIRLKNGRLRDHHDEFFNLSKSNREGRFHCYPRDPEFLLTIVHDEGIAVVSGWELSKATDIRLQQWAQLTGTIDRRINAAMLIDISQGVHFLTILGSDPGTGKAMLYDAEHKFGPKGSFSRTKVAPGLITFSRTIRLSTGSITILKGKEYRLRAGEKKAIHIGPVSESEQNRINRLRRGIRRRR